MLPTLNPFLDRRVKQTLFGLEREMSREEALAVLEGPKPSEWWEFSNVASALWLKGDTKRALDVAFQAYTMQPAVSTSINLAVILNSLARYKEGLEYSRVAYECDRTDDRAAQCYGEGLLQHGRFVEGWPLYVRGRTDLDWLRQIIPEWEGQNVSGRKIVAIEYGGYGDNIYFLRHLAELRRRGAKISYICQPDFAPLVRHLGYEPILNWSGNCHLTWRDYDYFIPLSSFGLRMRWALDNPVAAPYISMSRWHKLHFWRRIGICGRAGEGAAPRRSRTLSHSRLEKLRRSVESRFTFAGIIDIPLLELKNWLQTARVLAKLDLLVTVDTGVAHLAGAMGIRTWVMLPGGAAFQYPVGFEYHPFYPSMRLFWNRGEGLDDAVESVVGALWQLR